MRVNKPNHTIRWIVIYPVDSVIYLSFEQPGPVHAEKSLKELVFFKMFATFRQF